jgi:hypothetical protein
MERLGISPRSWEAKCSQISAQSGFAPKLAGAGLKLGFAFGESDEFGHKAVQDKVHMHDLHATTQAAREEILSLSG